MCFWKPGGQHESAIPLIHSVHTSNDSHKLWLQRTVARAAGTITNTRIAVLGLTHKPGTDTLRRSASVEACTWFSEQGAAVYAYDPAVHSLPDELNDTIHLCATVEEALHGADAAMIATPWRQFLEFTGDVRS